MSDNLIINQKMIKLDRIAAVILFIVILFYAITGYGMSRGLLDTTLAESWHLGWLGLIGLPAFIIHTFWSIHLLLIRRNIWNIYYQLLERL
jgi:hypothetical protein